MCHLSSGGLYAFVTLVLCVHWVIVSVRMFHPLATACQDMSSFVRWPVHLYAFVLYVHWVLWLRLSRCRQVALYAFITLVLCVVVCALGALGLCVVSSSWPVHLVTL